MNILSNCMPFKNPVLTMRSVVLLAASVLAAGCAPSIMRTTNEPIEYNEVACASYAMNLDSPMPFHLPIEAHQKLAKHGNAFCQLSLGDRYERGLGVPVDYARAREWYSLLPYRDLVFARMAREGVGQPVDLEQARAHYQKAADLGFAGGDIGLGELMELEKGSDKNRQVILFHYFKATKSYGDDGWVAMQRMPSLGATLNKEQKTDYNKLWIESFYSRVPNRIRRNKRSKEILNFAGKERSMTVQGTFSSNGTEPDFKILESSGFPEMDAFIIDLLEDIKMDPVQALDQSNRIQFEISLKFVGTGQSKSTDSNSIPSTPTR